MLFLFSILILFIKIFSYLFSIFVYNGPAVKMILIIVLFEFLYIIVTFGLSKYLLLSNLRKNNQRYFPHYKIFEKKDLYLNIAYILFYISIFIGLIFYLRVLNRNNELNLFELCSNIIHLIQSQSMFDLLLNVILLFLLLIIYLTLIMKSNKKFGREVIRLHLYLCFKFYPKYLNIYYFDGRLKYFNWTVDELQYVIFYNIIDKRLIRPINKYFDSDIRILHRCWKFLLQLHYYILFYCILFDIIFNNFIIHSYFQFLPYFFIYMLWIKISLALNLRDIGYDDSLCHILYDDIEITKSEIFGDIIYDSKGSPICEMEGLIPRMEYIQNGLWDIERYKMGIPKKGFLMKNIEKGLKYIIKKEVSKKILRYNYRRKLIEIHKINLKIFKLIFKIVIILTIMIISIL